MGAAWKISSYEPGVVRRLIGFYNSIHSDIGLKLTKELVSLLSSQVFAWSVLLSRFPGEKPLGGHLCHIKTQDSPSFTFNHHGHREGLKFGVFKGLQIIELYLRGWGMEFAVEFKVLLGPIG